MKRILFFALLVSPVIMGAEYSGWSGSKNMSLWKPKPSFRATRAASADARAEFLGTIAALEREKEMSKSLLKSVKEERMRYPETDTPILQQQQQYLEGRIAQIESLFGQD